jgi:hypothetical protein
MELSQTVRDVCFAPSAACRRAAEAVDELMAGYPRGRNRTDARNPSVFLGFQLNQSFKTRGKSLHSARI